MRIAHVNTYLGGGAPTAARRLHDTLVRKGVDSTFCFAAGTPPDPSYHPCFTGVAALAWKEWERARRWLRVMPYIWRRSQDFELFSDSGGMLPVTARSLPLGPDIVHLHWTADWLNYRSFFASLPRQTPLVWTLHDMHPFTGGCHYSFDCEKFTSACGECPQLNGLRSPTDPSRRNFVLKHSTMRDQNVHVVANSRWMEEQARQSAIFATAGSFRTIHYGLDTTAYAPKPRAECRKLLGIPEGAFTVCFGSDFLGNRRKGLRELLGALAQLREAPNLVGLLFGAGLPPEDTDRLPPIRSVGFLDSPARQSTVYSAADVFVIPSLAEAFGQTALEAMACGTPVVGFDTGGIPDMVRPRMTGLLVPVGDVAGLAEAIRWMMAHRAEREAMGHNARRMVEAEFTLERQARDYLHLYESLLAPRARASGVPT